MRAYLYIIRVDLQSRHVIPLRKTYQNILTTFLVNLHMLNLPSYVKETAVFINKSKKKIVKFKHKNSYLVTFDVSSVYTNIPHEEGIQASKYLLKAYGNCKRLSNN